MRILREDPEIIPIDFSWDIMSYSDNQIELQLDIKNSEQIGENFGEPE